MFSLKPGSALPIAIVLASLSTLAACGGSGDSSDPPVAASPQPTPTPTPQPTPTPDPPPVQITLQANYTPISQTTSFSQPDHWPAWNRTGTTVYDGIGCASAVNYHTHTMLSFYKDGVRLGLPTSIGRNNSCNYGIHTHDDSGVVHVETEAPVTYTMGQFFAEWGQPLSATSIAGLDKPSFYIIDNEKITPFSGDPATIVLSAHREILIVTGTPPTTVPRYDWAGSGL